MTPDAQAAPEQTATEAPVGPIPRLIAWVLKQKPVRVFLDYSSRGGPLMASGLSYQAIFAVFAAIWLVFSVAGLIVQGNIGIRDALITSISGAIPGLIDQGDGSGAIDPNTLLKAGVLGWSGAIALIGLLATALGWLASARDAVRRIFGVAALTTNFFLLKVTDLGLAFGFGLALIVSTVLSTFSTSLLGFALDFLGIGSASLVGTILGRGLGLIVVLALDTAVLAFLYRILSGVPIPRRRLIAGALIGGVGLGILKLLGNTLLGGTRNNPLLASFAIIIGLLIFFNLVCQVILLAAAWISVGMTDSGIAADPVAAATERKENDRVAALEKAAAEARAPRSLGARVGALFHRRRPVASGSETDATLDADSVGPK